MLAHLRGDRQGETAARENALATWKHNPEVDHLIGKKLSQKYRFEVGNAYQERALAFDAKYEPAQFQLSQDLLRTGREEEGWKLADAVFKADPYNVTGDYLKEAREGVDQYAKPCVNFCPVGQSMMRWALWSLWLSIAATASITGWHISTSPGPPP